MCSVRFGGFSSGRCPGDYGPCYGPAGFRRPRGSRRSGRYPQCSTCDGLVRADSPAPAPPRVAAPQSAQGPACRAGAGIICPSLPSRPGAGRDDGSTVNSGGQSRSPRRWSDPSPLKGSRSTPSTALWQWGLQARLSYQENSVPALDHSMVVGTLDLAQLSREGGLPSTAPSRAGGDLVNGVQGIFRAWGYQGRGHGTRRDEEMAPFACAATCSPRRGGRPADRPYGRGEVLGWARALESSGGSRGLSWVLGSSLAEWVMFEQNNYSTAVWVGQGANFTDLRWEGGEKNRVRGMYPAHASDFSSVLGGCPSPATPGV